MTPDDITHFRRRYPELKNVRNLARFKEGRDCRITLTLMDKLPEGVPLYSHDATYQSLFEKGWHSVTEFDIRLKRDSEHALA